MFSPGLQIVYKLSEIMFLNISQTSVNYVFKTLLQTSVNHVFSKFTNSLQKIWTFTFKPLLN